MFCDTSNLPRGRDRVRRAAAQPAAYSAHRAQLTFRAEGQPFLKVLPAVRKTVSNIPVSMVAVIGRQARTMSRHCLAGGSLQACSGATAGRCCRSFHDYWPRRRAGQADAPRQQTALSIGLSLPDGHLVRNAAWFP